MHACREDMSGTSFRKCGGCGHWVCMHMGVYMHGGLVYNYNYAHIILYDCASCITALGVVCVHRYMERCACAETSQKSLDVVLVLILEWTPADPLCCCGMDCMLSLFHHTKLAALFGSLLHF